MAICDDIATEIHDLTSKMIEVGLCVDSNYPRQSIHPSGAGPVQEVSVKGLSETSAAMKARPYGEVYTVLRENRAFNMQMIDGALLQFRYRFRGNTLAKHVLCFYPSPDLLEFQNDPEIYETDILYADLISKDTVTTPVRFDYDPSCFEDYLHPASHFTIGQYKNCRIPVAGGVTPYRFVNFVLRAFYNTPFHEYCSNWKGTVNDFDLTVTERESADLHWSFARPVVNN